MDVDIDVHSSFSCNARDVSVKDRLRNNSSSRFRGLTGRDAVGHWHLSGRLRLRMIEGQQPLSALSAPFGTFIFHKTIGFLLGLGPQK
jgi:hypothetical protein